MAEELRFFLRTSVYGLAIAAIYWFVSYEITGTALLGAFGLGSGALFLLLWWPGRSTAHAPEAAVFEDESGPVPLRSLAPLEVGFGIALLGLGLVYGIWFLIAAVVPLLGGAADWIASARREFALQARNGPPPG
jgi:hypothetical protein